MDPGRYTRVKEILLAARQLSGDERRRYLDDACGDDAGLREEVESFLPHDTSAPEILEEGALQTPIERTLSSFPEGTVPPPLPDRIGPYEILGVLGQGGMGVVYDARQTEPIRRNVAVKLIRRGFDTDRVVARFESERQALARMEHPGIARVLDAGADASGRPYFVMEKVDGLPITDYCAQHELDVEQRLRLFRLVCRAVQHAHRKGIMHRDLKPSNVLIARGEDGKPQPKIIDFGIAKATDASDTDQPALTQEGHLIGTPEYMSPEQAEGSRNVDIRTDVYSLGVVLYELLTGKLPYHFETHRYREIQRVLRETDPPPPSRAVPDGPAAERRRRRLQGDLDNIVLMALRKEPDRRYGTVDGFEEDIDRHLRGLTVTARKDTWAYRTGKFVSRHRTGVAGLGLLFALLVAFSFFLARERNRAVAAEHVAREEADRARTEAETAAAVSNFLAELFQLSDPSETKGNTVTAREILDRGAARVDEELKDSPRIRGRLLHELGVVYHGLGLYDRALEMLERSLAVREETHGARSVEVAFTLQALGNLTHDRGEYDRSIEVGRRAVDIVREVTGETSEELAGSLLSLAPNVRVAGDLDGAERLLDEASEILLATVGRESEEYADCRMSLGYLYTHQGRLDEAQVALEEALAIQRRLLTPPHPVLAQCVTHLGGVHLQKEDYEAALPYCDEALEMYRQLYPDGHAAIGMGLHNRGVVLSRLGRKEEAAASVHEALEMSRRTLGPEHPYVALTTLKLAQLEENAGHLEAAENSYREALALARSSIGDDHPRTVGCWYWLGRFLLDSGRPEEAEPLLAQAVKIHEASSPPDDADRRRAREALDACRAALR